jgi:hypothetical protein
MSYCLYKYMSRSIIMQRQHNQSNLYFSYFCPNFLAFFSFLSIRFTSRRFNLQSCHGSRISTIQMPLDWRRSISSQPDGAPDCRQSQQNRSVWFLKSEGPVSTVSNRGLRFLFVSQKYDVPVDSLEKLQSGLLISKKVVKLKPVSMKLDQDQCEILIGLLLGGTKMESHAQKGYTSFILSFRKILTLIQF